MIPIAVVLLAASAPETGPGRTLALVTLSPSNAERMEQARARVPGVVQWLGDARLMRALEGFERPPSAAERAREALASARERLRLLDVAAVSRALADAQAAAQEFAPSLENRALAAEISVQRAQLEFLEGNRAAALQTLGFALSAAPALDLDPARYPPTMIEALAHARRQAEEAPAVSCPIETSPSGAAIEVEGAPGTTPLTASLRAGPRILWIHKDGRAPKAAWEVVGAGCHLTWTLDAADETERLQPFVDAVRQNEGERRRAAAQALAEVLRMDGVAVLPAMGLDPVVYWRSPPPGSRSDAPWYRDAWGDLLAAAGIVALGSAAVSVGVADRQAQLTQTAGDYPSYLGHRQSAQSLRTAGGVMAAAGALAVTAGILRYVWFRPRAAPVAVAVFADSPASVGLILSGSLGE
jgi:hypothetical protein